MSRPLARPTKIYNIQVKSHKLTIMHTGLSPTTKIGDVKSETLSALKLEVATDALDVLAMEPPAFDVQTEDDFELCRAIKDKGRLTGEFEVLEPSVMLKESGISGWEVVFLQFRDRGTGNLLPIEYTLPPMYDEEEEIPVSKDTKGKRKASVELDETTLDF